MGNQFRDPTFSIALLGTESNLIGLKTNSCNYDDIRFTVFVMSHCRIDFCSNKILKTPLKEPFNRDEN